MTDAPRPAPEAGHELDAEIARRVFGYRLVNYSSTSKPMYAIRAEGAPLHESYVVPAYSTDIEAAYLVLAFMFSEADQPTRHRFYAALKDDVMHDRLGGWLHRYAEHPLMVCVAALRAVEGEASGE